MSHTPLFNDSEYPILSQHVGIPESVCRGDYASMVPDPIMLQAITTRYMGPTNHLGPRVKATCEAGSFTTYWDDALSIQQNHYSVASMLHTKLGWNKTSTLVGGWSGDTGTWVQVLRE